MHIYLDIEYAVYITFYPQWTYDLFILPGSASWISATEVCCWPSGSSGSGRPAAAAAAVAVGYKITGAFHVGNGGCWDDSEW